MKRMKLQYVFIICLSITIKEAFASTEIPNEEKDEKFLSILEGWQNFENKVKNLTNAGLKLAVPMITKNFGSMNLSEDCMKNINHLILGLEEIKPWAMKFIDSSGKFIDGILTGSFTSFGSYDECLNIEVKNQDVDEELLFRGQYCTIMMEPPVPPRPNYMKMHKVPVELKNFSQRDTAVAELSKNIHLLYVGSLRLGICLPSRCNIQDVNKMAQLLGRELSLSARASRCEEKEDTILTPSAIFVITLYSFFVILLVVGSSIDIYSHYSKTVFKNTAIRVLLAFSFLTNFKRFSSPAPKSNNLNFLYGIRFLGVIWIVYGHGCALLINGVTHELKESEKKMQHFTFQPLLNASFSVDTFFFMSGMLVCYVTLKFCKHQDKKFNVPMYIVHRIWRIFPAYFFILMATFLMHMLGSGPLWHDMLDFFLENCRKNWWANVLFINNFYDTDHSCFVHFWYVAADFQLYVYALVIILPILRWPKIGMSLAGLTIIASACYSAIITYVKELPPTMLFTVMDLQTIMPILYKRYFKPFPHAGPYAIGILAGYLLSTKPKMKISSFKLAIGWILALVLALSILQGTLPWYNDVDTSLASNLAYASLSKFVWTLAVAWMTICCATGNGGIINYILSMRAFVPLGRISYLAYLIHFPMQFAFVAKIRTRIQSDTFILIWLFFGHVVASYAFAFLIYMMVEAPFMNLEKICFSKRGQNEENNKVRKEQNNFKMDIKSGKNEDFTPTSTIHM